MRCEEAAGESGADQVFCNLVQVNSMNAGKYRMFKPFYEPENTKRVHENIISRLKRRTKAFLTPENGAIRCWIGKRARVLSGGRGLTVPCLARWKIELRKS